MMGEINISNKNIYQDDFDLSDSPKQMAHEDYSDQELDFGSKQNKKEFSFEVNKKAATQCSVLGSSLYNRPNLNSLAAKGLHVGLNGVLIKSDGEAEGEDDI